MKKILIVTYYWPPFSGSGVQRWLKFAKYLPSFNWQPFIYTPKNPYIKTNDFSLMNDIPKDVQIWKTKIWEPYKLRNLFFKKKLPNQSEGVISNQKTYKNRILNWIRGNFFIPDPKVFWVKPSVKFLINKIKENNISHIITTGPPHSMHLIGLMLKENFPHLKWIVDFRDPWTDYDMLEDFYLTESSTKKHHKLEKRVIQNADVILSVSETWCEKLKKMGASKIYLLTNGYDSSDFTSTKKNHDKFIIGHYGLINHLRNPLALWNTLNNLCVKNDEFFERLEIHLSGNIDSSIFETINNFSHIRSKVKYLGYLTHVDVLKCYNKTSVLLLLLFNSKTGIGNYPGKIFEYLASNKPILAFGPKDSDAKRLLDKFSSHGYFNYESNDFEQYILNIFNNPNQSINNRNIEKFSRESLTNELVKILNKMI